MDIKTIQAKINTYNYWLGHKERGICPKCGEYMLIDGYVCFGCGYDPTAEYYTPKDTVESVGGD